MKNIWTNLILIALMIFLAVGPLILLKDAEFKGADSLAEQAIEESNPDYEPWFFPIFEPASGEIESLLFALQASIGTGIIFYIFGYWRGLKKRDAHPETL